MLLLSISNIITFLQSSFLAVGYISKNNLFPEPLSMEEEQMYIERFAGGDMDARKVLIERNLRLVAHVCKKYCSSGNDLDDLIASITKKELGFLHMFQDVLTMKY